MSGEDMDLERMTVGELREMATELEVGWKDDGGRPLRKAALIERVATALGAAGDDTPMERPPSSRPQPKPPEAPQEPAEPGAITYWKVKRHARYCIGGMIHRLAPGLIISSKTHDLDDVRAQGVRLEPAEEPSLGVDAYGDPLMPHGREFGPPDSLPREDRPQLAGHRDGSRIEPDGTLSPPEDEPKPGIEAVTVE